MIFYIFKAMCMLCYSNEFILNTSSHHFNAKLLINSISWIGGNVYCIVAIKCHTTIIATCLRIHWIPPIPALLFVFLTHKHSHSARGGCDLTHKQNLNKTSKFSLFGIPVRLETHRQTNYMPFPQTPSTVTTTCSLHYSVICALVHVQHGSLSH